MFTQVQLIKAAFVAVLETRSVGSMWPQRERDSNCSLSLKYITRIEKDAEEKRCCTERTLKKKTKWKRNM